MGDLQMYLELQKLEKERMSFRMGLVDKAGDLVAGLVLSKAMDYLTDETTKVVKEEHLWIVKPREEWCSELRISLKQLDRALRILQEKGFIEKKTLKYQGTPVSHIRLTM